MHSNIITFHLQENSTYGRKEEGIKSQRNQSEIHEQEIFLRS